MQKIRDVLRPAQRAPRGLTLWHFLWGWVNKDLLKEHNLQPTHYTQTHMHTERLGKCRGLLRCGKKDKSSPTGTWRKDYSDSPLVRLHFLQTVLYHLALIQMARWCRWGVRGFARGRISIIHPPHPLVFLAWQRNNRSTIQGFHLYSDKGYLGNLELAISHYGESYEAEIKFCSQWLWEEGRWKVYGTAQ